MLDCRHAGCTDIDLDCQPSLTVDQLHGDCCAKCVPDTPVTYTAAQDLYDEFRADTFANPAGLVMFVQRNSVAWKLRPDQKVVVKGEWTTPEARLAAAEKILSQLAQVAMANP